ncbi:CS1-pili formation C-terminal domain-containing protein [Sphingomonas sp. PAMC 26617]|uniref:CS1-pili formation C-terminal domain-containing protein n=1 Tax=Sphingomonas sp. PAMC 26617 TaxID=1112216 RepID=UPI000314A91A|nr:CS1-pili formation C-terminal domain-containing protein [Sphingomonas sp. PAMC 26617]
MAARSKGNRWRLTASCRIIIAAVLAPAIPTSAYAATPGDDTIRVGTPAEFNELARTQQAIVDVYLGDRRIGQAAVEYEPGKLRFLHPDIMVAMVPDILQPASIASALSDPLDAHSNLLCTPATDPRDCGRLTPNVVGVIFDQDRFRLSLFINPRFLKVRAASEKTFLSRPTAGLALVDSVAGTLAGGSGGNTVYALQNRAVLGDRDARIISTTSFASGSGLKPDVLVAQVDKPGLRYTAGLFWAPGIDLIGRRKLLGGGVETQFDTRLDKSLISGSPIVVALSQRSRVDILVNGRLMTSRTYEAGNQSLDTSGLPDGVGVLVNDATRGFLSPTRQPYGEAGVARRMSGTIALDASLVMLAGKAIGELGTNWIAQRVQVRVAALASSRRDYGLLAQVNSTGSSPLTFNLDVRRVYSHDDQPLVPIDTLEPNVTTGYQIAQLSAGNFTQALADVGYRLQGGQIGFSAFCRRDSRRALNYAIGPTGRWSIVHRRGFDLTVEANLSQSNVGRSAYAGLRLQLLRLHSAFSATAGGQTIGSRSEGARSGAVGGVQATWQHDDVLGGNLSLGGNYDHTPDGDLAHARADMRGRFGTVATDFIQQINGARGTQYSLGVQTAAIVNRDLVALGGRDQTDSVIAVRIDDAPPNARFQILVDETPRGIVRGRETRTIAVPPYRRYSVRIKPIGGHLMHFDSESRMVSIYPGNVAALAWTAKPVVAIFGRVVRANGDAIGNADLIASDAISHSDDQGYFQIETAPETTVLVRSVGAIPCQAALSDKPLRGDYLEIGTVTCLPLQPSTPTPTPNSVVR